MKKNERASLVRVLVDLIKADSVIDEGEMVLYAKLVNDYSISKEDEISASSMTLADAISTLSTLPIDVRESLMEVFSDMTVSDGFCAKQEAQLMLALIYCLQEEKSNMCDVYSVHEPDVLIEDNQVIYVESAYDKNINDDIRQNYRSIDKELRLAGFNFVYLPHIVSHYKTTETELFKQITNFLAPNIPTEEIPSLIDKLTSVTTAEYCNEQLCNKLGLAHLRDVTPSLLIKISSTHVGDLLYTNFLRVSIDDEVLPLVQEIIDIYCRMLSSDTRYVTNNEEAFGQFLYHGFYKQLFDIYVIRQGVRSKIVLDPFKGTILLPELGREIQGLHRRDKALYALLLIESEFGGMDFSLPSTARQKEISRKDPGLFKTNTIIYMESLMVTNIMLLNFLNLKYDVQL